MIPGPKTDRKCDRCVAVHQHGITFVILCGWLATPRITNVILGAALQPHRITIVIPCSCTATNPITFVIGFGGQGSQM